MKCEHCGAILPEKALFCPECGNKIVMTKKCPVCHAEVGAEYKFCVQCGASLQDENTDSQEKHPSIKTKEQEMLVVKCPQCGKLLKEDAKECTDCGYKFVQGYTRPAVSMQTCPSCGASISDMNRVCPECGCRLDRRLQLTNKSSGLVVYNEKNRTKTHHMILTVMIVVIMLLSFAFWLYFRHHPIQTTEDVPQIQKVEPLDVPEEIEQDEEIDGQQDEDETFEWEDDTRTETPSQNVN